MQSCLDLFDLDTVEQWLREAKAIDAILLEDIQSSLPEIYMNNNEMTPNLVERFSEKLQQSGLSPAWDIGKLEAFYGYTVYTYPDNGRLKIQGDKPNMYYGLAKATSYGVTHEHYLTDSYNRVLEGEGVFVGSPQDKGRFPRFYDGDLLVKDKELEIYTNMAHGHLAKKGSSVWILFVQECGFKPDLKCAGDFHITPNCDISRFGKDYL